MSSCSVLDTELLLVTPEQPARSPAQEREEFILDWLQDFCFNTMELCRLCNDRDPYQFRGCYKPFSFEAKNDRCNHKERGCSISSGAIDSQLRRMEKKGRVRSLKIRWFDGRDPGAARDSIQLDNFRLYYLDKETLANRLIRDVKQHIGG